MGRSVASPCVGVVLLAGIFELLKHGVYSEFFPLHDGSMKSKQENPNLRCDPVAIASFFFFSSCFSVAKKKKKTDFFFVNNLGVASH